MNYKFKHSIYIFSASFCVLTLSSNPVFAFGLNKTVSCDLTANAPVWSCDQITAVVKASQPEFQLGIFGINLFQVDLGTDFIQLNYLDSSSLGLSGGEFLTLIDLDWLNYPEDISSFTLETFGDLTGLEDSNIFFTADSVSVDFGGSQWGAGSSARLTLNTTNTTIPDSVPTPAVILPSLFSIGTAAIRKKNTPKHSCEENA